MLVRLKIYFTLFLFIKLFIIPVDASAQDSDSLQVMQVIKVFFDGLAEKDSTAMLSVTDPDTRLVLTSSMVDGTPVMRALDIQQFVQIVSGEEGPDMLETYWSPTIRIHDNLATVWLNYNFYVNDQLDHCGEDAFQLYRSTAGWKIAAIADTQRRTGCIPEPEAGDGE